MTKQKIAMAAQELMARRSLDRITVRDIVEECHITRQTFYYHFKDILDLLEWGLKNNMESLLRSCQTSDNIEDAILNCLKQMDQKEHRLIMTNIWKSRYRNSFEHIVMKEFKKYFAELLSEKKLLENLSTKEALFLIDFYSGAVAMMLGRWCADGKQDIEDGVHMIIRAMRGDLHI